MATYASAPRAAHNLGAGSSNAPQQRRPLPTTNDLPPPPPKSPPPTKPKKIQLPSPPPVIRDNHRGQSFKRCSFLGEGGFARVYEVSDENHVHHAIKVVAKVNLHSKKSKTKLYAEIRLHRALKHPNIVLFADCFEDDEHVYMSMELCENGSLNDLLRRRKRYTEPETRFFGMQLIGACHYMHTHQVIHRDLKLGNIFLDRDMNVKVGDFGLAALIETPGDRKKTICGTPNYIAPEVLFDTANGHSFEVDTWSIGVILYTLLIGKPPFQTTDVKLIYERIKNNKYEFPPNKPISTEGQALITAILTHDPKQRPSLHEIIDHDFFTRSIFPPSIPTSAHEYPPSFSNITRQQSKINYVRVRRAVLLDTDDTDIDTIDVADTGATLDAATQQQQRQQERDFNKAVQPGSPISVLLRSAREPLLVTKSPLRNGHVGDSRPPPSFPTSNGLYRKLASVPVNGKTPSIGSLASTNAPFPAPPNLDDDPPAPERKPSGSVRSRQASSSAPSNRDKENRGPSSPVRQAQTPQALQTLHDEQTEARRHYELASQKARIVSQMAGVDSEGENAADAASRPRGKDVGAERPQRERRTRDDAAVPVGRGLADDETENIKPIRETPRKPTRGKAGKSTDPRNVSIHSSTGPSGAPTQTKLQGYEDFAVPLNEAIKAIDEQRAWRRPSQDAGLQPPRIFIQSWVDYCNKYGMGYALTNGCIGVHFNDSTTMVLSADKHHFEYLSSRRNGVAYVRKNYTVDDYPKDLKSKVYLLRHFERYMLDRLIGEAETTPVDVGLTSDLTFVHKYLRMTNVLLFKLSHDVLQFNFFDHTKLIVSHRALHLLYIDKHGTKHPLSLAQVVEDAVSNSLRMTDEAKKFNSKLVRKLTFCKDLLHHILTYSGSRVEEGESAAPPSDD